MFLPRYQFRTGYRHMMEIFWDQTMQQIIEAFVGGLQYLTLTWPNISFSLNNIC
jgi:hypothetical protein